MRTPKSVNRDVESNQRHRMTKKQASAATILELVDFIVDQSENTGLESGLLRELNTPLSELGNRYSISPSEALLLAVFINNFEDHHIRVVDLSRHFACKQVRLLGYWEQITNLAKRHYIRMGKSSEEFFQVSPEFMVAVRENRVYSAPSYRNLKADSFFARVETLLKMRSNEVLSIEDLETEIRDIIMNNQHLKCCQEISHLPITDGQMSLLLATAVLFLRDGDEHVIGNDVTDFFESQGELRGNLRKISNGTHPLQTHGFIENVCDDGMVNTTAWHLTLDGKCKMFSEMDIELKKEDDKKGLLTADKITEKKLYFRPETQAQVDKLRRLLSEERFREVQERLEQNGMRRGVACIFYGGPGTGKTETVLQLARESGRGLMMVDISQMRDKYVGETEKRIKRVFDHYRQLVREQSLAPILLFNEADALFCKRNENAVDGVDKMENAMQNIILQEMETLDGILIATTNLASSMDSAFERRFLYKLEFQNPSPEEARHIWEAMLKGLGEDDARLLAREFGFSGGQIENIARKHLISTLIDEEELSLDGLRDLCKQEVLKKRTGGKVGFAA